MAEAFATTRRLLRILESAELQAWASETEEGGLLYLLAFEVNNSVILAADRWRQIASWAALFGISMIDATGEEKVVRFETVTDFSERWREKLVTLFAEVLAHEMAVDLISQGHFQGNEVLFTDTREYLTASGKCSRQLIIAYNWYAAHEGKEPIDIDGNDVPAPGHVEQLRNSWVRLSRARALSGMGKIFEARDEVLSLLRSQK